MFELLLLEAMTVGFLAAAVLAAVAVFSLVVAVLKGMLR